MGFKLRETIKRNKRYFLLIPISFILHLPLRLAEDWFHNWVNTHIAEKWSSIMSIIGIFIEWGLPALLAVGILVFIFHEGRKYERERTKKEEVPLEQEGDKATIAKEELLNEWQQVVCPSCKKKIGWTLMASGDKYCPLCGYHEKVGNYNEL